LITGREVGKGRGIMVNVSFHSFASNNQFKFACTPSLGFRRATPVSCAHLGPGMYLYILLYPAHKKVPARPGTRWPALSPT
jgi:hypothetical protein